MESEDQRKKIFAGLPLPCIIIHVNATEGKNGEDLGTRLGGGGMHITKNNFIDPLVIGL